MICSVILYYTLVFNNGIYDGHIKYLNKDNTKNVLKLFEDERFKQENNIRTVTNVRIEHVKDFDCSKGPINWVK